MATLPELEQALIGADKAGDTAGAKLIAEEIVRMRAAPATAPVTPAPSESWTPPPPSLTAAPPEDPWRKAKLYGQAVGSGLTSAAMFPLDVPAYIQKGLEWGFDKGLNAFGLPTKEQSYMRAGITTPPPSMPIPSEAVKEGASWLAQKLGYTPVTPETPSERLQSNIVEFGANAAGGATALSRLAAMRAAALAKPGATPLITDKFVRPYFEAPTKAIIGDTLAGGTAGAALTGSQEYLPQNVRQMGGGAVGAGADLLAMLAGGVSGGTAASAVLNAPKTIPNAIRNRLDALDVPVNPATGLPYSNRTADDVALLLQSGTTGAPGEVARGMQQRVQEFKDQGLPLPTTGLLADDIGLAGMEKRQRTQAGPGTTQPAPGIPAEVREMFSFGARDQALRDAAAREAQSIRPTGADPTVFPQRAADVSEMRLEQAQRAIDQPTGQARGVQIAREAPATEIAAAEGSTPGASSNIFDVYAGTRALERDRSQALYARPEFTEAAFDYAPLRQAVVDIASRATPTAPITPRAAAIIDRIAAAEGETLTGRELAILNKDIESEIKLSLRDGQDFQQLKALKDGIAQTITQLPASDPARAAIDVARANTRDVIAPNFREGYGGTLDMRLKSSPGQVAPETAGAGFLNRGQDAEQLMRIAELRGNTQEVATNARAIVFDQLARSGIIKNGVIDPAKLTSWRNQRAGIIDAIPGLGDEVNAMIAGARSGAGKAAQYADEIAAAEARLAQTQKDVAQGPLGMVAGKDPQKAVSSIFSSDNPVQNMKDLKAQMGNNPAANQSLKAATTDYFLNKIKQLDPHGDAEFGVRLNALVKEFDKNRAVLAEVLTPDEMQALQRAQTALKPLTQRNVQATVGSTTAESESALMKPLELALKTYYGTLVGGSRMRNFRIALQLMRGDTKAPIEQLLTQTMFDPELAAMLLTRDVPKPVTPAWNAQLQKVLRRTEVAKELATDDEE